jgi:hypothetical protein
MKTELLLAGMLLSSAPAMAAHDAIPDICKSVANYATQALALQFSDGTFSDKYNPTTIQLIEDFKTYPFTSIKDLGNCDQNPHLKKSWCNVAGGSPEVYQLDVAESDGADASYPFATVIVTFNRGGCWVDSADRK